MRRLPLNNFLQLSVNFDNVFLWSELALILSGAGVCRNISVKAEKFW